FGLLPARLASASALIQLLLPVSFAGSDGLFWALK
ncbi:MAG: hypothetical protein ACI82H_000730, partial [Alphaproteobacteria bacterium]